MFSRSEMSPSDVNQTCSCCSFSFTGRCAAGCRGVGVSVTVDIKKKGEKRWARVESNVACAWQLLF